jgi:hypothetical protein
MHHTPGSVTGLVLQRATDGTPSKWKDIDVESAHTHCCSWCRQQLLLLFQDIEATYEMDDEEEQGRAIVSPEGSL